MAIVIRDNEPHDMNESSTHNVLHIASGDLWAGAEVQLFTLAKSLIAQDSLVIHVVLLNHGTLEQRLIEHDIDVIVIDESKLNGLQVFLQLLTVIRRIRPDIIHTHRVKENILGSISARLNHRPSLRTTHGASEHKPAWHQIPQRTILFFDWFCGRFLQKTIIAVSDELAGKLRNDFPAEKIKVIENGIDLSSLQSGEHPVRSEIGGEPYRIGIAGRLVPVKRIDLFIEAAATLSASHTDISLSFSIYGDGPLHTELTTMSQTLDTDLIINFEGHCDNMQQELAALDILLITSDHEGLPMILLEAMALKVPVIAHAVGGIPTVVNHGECGVLVSEQQASAYVDAILKLIRNPELRTNITQKAFDRVNDYYSADRNAATYRSVYDRLAAH